MSDAQENAVIREFRDRVAGRNFEKVNVLYRVSGGMPSERGIEEEFQILGRGAAAVRSTAQDGVSRQVEAPVSRAEVQDLYVQLEQGIESLAPRSAARFLPDSLLGCVTIEVDGKQAALYFLADEEQRREQQKPIPPAMSEAIRKISRLSADALEKGGG